MDAQVLGAEILQCYTANMVELRTSPANFTIQVSERPVASPLARWQANSGLRVTSLRHEVVNLDEFNRQLVKLLDGNHDRAALLEALNGLVAKGVLVAEQQGQPVKDPTALRELLTQVLDYVLPYLARCNLLLK